MTSLDQFTKEQRKVVLHGCKDGRVKPTKPLLVLAGAGTGKTQTLAAFAAHRIANGTDPTRILLLAFENKAAGEMEQRLANMIGTKGNRRDGGLTHCGTFHATGLRFTRRYADRLGLSSDFTVHARAESARLMTNVLAEQGRAIDQTFPSAEMCLRIYSYRANTQQPLRKVLARRFSSYEPFKKKLVKAFQAYDRAKRSSNVVDFDDLLTFWDRLLDDKKVSRRIQRQFDYVVVDEYQDTTHLQDAILRKLRPTGRGLVLVGDDDQCIYGFRGVAAAQILKKAESVKVLKLTRSHRSTQPILDACNIVMTQAQDRVSKELWSKRSGPRPRLTVVKHEHDQVLNVVGRITEAVANGIPLCEQAVLSRTSGETKQLEEELARRGIPFQKVGGSRLLDDPGVKAMIAVLRWCENPKDTVAGAQVFELMLGLDVASTMRVVVGLKGAIKRTRLLKLRPTEVSNERWAALVGLVDSLQDEAWISQVPKVCRWLKKNSFVNSLTGLGTCGLGQYAKQYPTRREFLEAFSLKNDADEQPTDAAGLTISTIHSAKGREWTAVYILNAVDGCIPLRRAAELSHLEEERRILFVAMTRAKKRLELFVPKRLRASYAANLGTARSHFISKRMLRSFAGIH